MRPYLLAENNWKSVKDNEYDLAVLPWGATEAHNFHLPYSSDSIESEFLSAECARIAWEMGGKVIVLPNIPYGVNTGQTDIKLDINIYPSTQLAILNDVIEVLNRQAIKKLLVFNSHGGNDFKPLLRELGVKYPEMFLSSVDWFRVLDRYDYFEKSGDHAEEMETSLLLNLRPDLVLPKKEWGRGKVKLHKLEAFREGWAWTERKWSKITDDTGVGDPLLATKEKGELFFKAITEKIGQFIFELCKMDMNDMHEDAK